MHVNEGQIRAYLDRELSPAETLRVETHLERCPACRSACEKASARMSFAAERLAALEPNPLQAPSSAATARRRLEARLAMHEKENETMLSRIFSRLSRPAWAVLTVAVLLLASLAFPQVRAIANSFLGLFRVQQVRVVQVNPGDLPALGQSGRFESLMTRNVQFEQTGESQEVSDAAEASALLGFPVRLIKPDTGVLELQTQAGGVMNFQVDVELVQAILEEIGRTDIHIPGDLQGADVTLTVPQGLIATYGSCEFDPAMARAEGYDPDDSNAPSLPLCTAFYQLPSPEIDAPPGLDLVALGEAYLQLLGMSQEEAQQFAATVDWTSTFILPIPLENTQYAEVPVDGVTGTLVEHRINANRSEYVLIWVKDGILYALMGPGNRYTALNLVETLP